MDQIKIGKFIASLRRSRGWTQQQLGERLGVTNKTVSRWENARYLPDIEMLQLLSALFGVSVEALMAGGPVADPPNPAGAHLAAASAKENFTMSERRAYWQKKWKQEHWPGMAAGAGILLCCAAAAHLLGRPVLTAAALLLTMVFLVFQRSRMFGYLEEKLYVCARLKP